MADIKRHLSNSKTTLSINGAVCVLVLCLLGLGLCRLPETARAQSAEYRAKQEELRLTESRIRATKAEIVRMERQKERLNSPNGVEEAARDQLGMVRQGEVVYVVNKPAGQDAVSQETETSRKAKFSVSQEPETKPSTFFRVMDKVLY